MRSAARLVLAGGSLAVAASVAVVPLASPEPTPVVRPAPTEHWLDADAEAENKRARKAWFRERHRAPDGVDVEAIERANGLFQTERRNRMWREGAGSGFTWVERGSENLAGRMHVAVHSRDGEHIYAGSSLGGVWRGSLSGEGWEPLADNLYGGAHWLAVIPAATGEPDVLLAATDHGLVHRSTDDGHTWTAPLGLGSLHEVRRLLHDQDGTVYLVGHHWDEGTLFRSLDGGASFEEVLDLGAYRGDVWGPRTGDGGVLWLVHDNEVLVSTDLGDSWDVLGGFGGDYQRAELVGSEAGGPRMWAMAETEDYRYDLYRSDDAGKTWAQVRADIDDYWGSLAASTVDPDRFAWGGVEVFVTRDGGQEFTRVNRWDEYYDHVEDKLHADVPGIDVVPVGDGEIWYVSTDGGLYRSFDALDTVENLSLSGLRVSQYYDTHTSTADPTHVAAGSQDQGYQHTLDLSPIGELYTFDQLISGDYGYLTSSDGTHELVYSVYPGMLLIQIGEDDPQLSYGWFPDTRSAWLPPIEADPDDPEALFFAGSELYRYTRQNELFWDFERWSSEDFAESQWEYISALAFAPTDSNRAYLATNRGRMFRSDDHGLTWTRSGDLGPEAPYYYGTALVVSHDDPDVAWVAGSGYAGHPVYRTTDGGQSWIEFGQGLPQTLVYCLGEAPDGSGRLFVGTETSVYLREPGGVAWIDVTEPGVPVTIFWSVEPLFYENTMRFGTYGRGIWDLQLDVPGEGCFPARDDDQDGASCVVDCEDQDPSVYPGAPDYCDGVDSDCSPLPVEDDADGDGFLACEECDDSDPLVYPGADDEPRDGIDQDCDGEDARRCGCAGAGIPVGAWPLVLLVLPGVVRRRVVASEVER